MRFEMSRFEEKSVEDVGTWLLQEKFSEDVIKNFKGIYIYTYQIYSLVYIPV